MFGVELQFKAYLVVKPRNPRNHAPKFQTKFGVAKEEPHGPGERLAQRLGQRRHHHCNR